MFCYHRNDDLVFQETDTFRINKELIHTMLLRSRIFHQIIPYLCIIVQIFK